MGEHLGTVVFSALRMPSLVFLAGPIAGRRYKLADGEYIIGRKSDCQIFVPDMRVSRQHARLWKAGEAWQIEDLGSNNGTFVNGAKIAIATPLQQDDEVLIANNRIRVELTDPVAESRPPEGNPVTIVDVAGTSSLIRSREDHGHFVVLSAAFPSRLLSAFPAGTAVTRLTLDEALQRVAAGAFGKPATIESDS